MDYSIVVPVYNSAETLAILMQELNAVMSKLKVDFEIIFVDDCSNDESWQVLKDIKITK
jgi:glycosyltransferase involved in cell wall biosynthesis